MKRIFGNGGVWHSFLCRSQWAFFLLSSSSSFFFLSPTLFPLPPPLLPLWKAAASAADGRSVGRIWPRGASSFELRGRLLEPRCEISMDRRGRDPFLPLDVSIFVPRRLHLLPWREIMPHVVRMGDTPISVFLYRT